MYYEINEPIFSLNIHALFVHLMFNMEISLLEKKATAVELIRKRLSERPNDPRLWYVTLLILLLVFLIRL
jgi:hypothetical protein